MTQFAFLLLALISPAIMTFSYRHKGRGEKYLKLIFNFGLLVALATAVTLVLIPVPEGTLWLEQQVQSTANNPVASSTREMLSILCCFILGAAAMSFFFAKIRNEQISDGQPTTVVQAEHEHADNLIPS